MRQKFSQRITLAGLLFLTGASTVLASNENDSARPLLMQALENQYQGRYQATLELVNDHFSEGRDSLFGKAEFANDIGERRICLASPKKAFEYRSLNFGKEQWITDESTQRVRRIANRQWKKGVFGTLLTYEDMLKLPVDFFLEYSSCKGVTTTDSTYQIGMTVKPLFQSFYSRIDVTLSKTPVLLRSMTFYGKHGEKLKTMDVTGYQEKGGKWLVSDLSVADKDSLSTLKMCFRNFSFVELPQVLTAEQNAKVNLQLIAKRPLVDKVGVTKAVPEDAEMESTEDISN